MKKILLTALAVATTCGAMAQKPYEQGKPNNPDYAYLSDYAPLKEYIDKEKYPNFKLGIGTTVNEYLKKGTVYGLTNDNFTETVAGNAMKMSSCVNNSGTMNFTTVKNYVKAATEAGLNVYGHTLAWHSQQPKTWLLSLIADKPAPPIEGDVTVLQTLANKDFTKDQTIGWHADYSQYHYNITFSSANGMKVTNTQKQDNWVVQYIGMSDIPTVKGDTYTITMTVKGTGTGYVTAKLGDWSAGNTVNFNFNTEWQDVTKTIKAAVPGSFLLLQSGQFVGDLYIKNIKIEKQVQGLTTTEDRRCIVVNATERTAETWDNQFWLVTGSFASGAKYEFTADVRADAPATASTQLHSTPGNYVHNEAVGNVSFSTEWRTIKSSGTFSKAGSSIAFNLSELAAANNYYFDNLSLKINGVEKLKNGDCEGTDLTSFKKKVNGGAVVDANISDGITYVYVPSTVPQTKEEKHDTLVYAMDKWISGMMNACEGKVKAWDVVNEAISGGGNDGQGNYTLQHSDGYNPDGTWDVGGDAFYWQDYMGDLEYVRQAVRLARKYGPEDVKLFINDYNLESTWDGNKKLKSLINWIKKWEDDGVTCIDGIGTQMHISYILDKQQQKNQENAITKMFELMAATGKLVRVSELDMGICEKQFGASIKTADVTEEQHKLMADYYEWIIKEYLRIIPADQQWGICQWCPTDAPSNSGWRGGEPVGIWDLQYYRKHVYAGFAKGLGGIPSAIEEVHVDAPAQQNVYSLDGICVRRGTTSLDGLKPGMYIIGGKKVVLN